MRVNVPPPRVDENVARWQHFATVGTLETWASVAASGFSHGVMAGSRR
jgi:hypothetical protein